MIKAIEVILIMCGVNDNVEVNNVPKSISSQTELILLSLIVYG